MPQFAVTDSVICVYLYVRFTAKNKSLCPLIYLTILVSCRFKFIDCLTAKLFMHVVSYVVMRFPKRNRMKCDAFLITARKRKKTDPSERVWHPD